MEMRPGADHEELLVRLREENAALRAALTRREGGQELARQREEFSLLLDVSKRIISELNLETVLQLVADKARDLVQARPLVPRWTRRASNILSGRLAPTLRAFGNDFPVRGMCGWVPQNERILFGESSPFPLTRRRVVAGSRRPCGPVRPEEDHRRAVALGKKGGSFPARSHLMTMFANQVSTATETPSCPAGSRPRFAAQVQQHGPRNETFMERARKHRKSHRRP
jgi:hypothetical protein